MALLLSNYTIQVAGNVGVRTATPEHPIHLVGDTYLESGDFDVPSGFITAAFFGGDGGALSNIQASNIVGTLSIDEASMPDLTVTNLLSVSGNADFTGSHVGIGNVNDGTHTLYVEGTSRFNGDVEFAGGNVSIVDGSLIMNVGSVSANGAPLYDLNASNISWGTLDNARLDADVAITTSLAVDTDTLYAAGTSVGVNTASPDASFHVVGNAKISSDLIVGGSLTVQGNLTYLDTEVQVTEAVDITNAGTGPALKANQTGSEPIAEFQDDGVTVMKIFDGGNVAIGNVSADYLLTVDGIVSAEAYRGNAYALFDINAANVVGDITLDTASMFDLTVTNLISLEGNAKFDQNVAIGTALDPAYALKVQGNVWFGSDVRIESGVLYGNVDLVDGQVTTLEITEKLTVSGNADFTGSHVGIGNVSDNIHTLYVEGNSRFVGDVEFAGGDVSIVDGSLIMNVGSVSANGAPLYDLNASNISWGTLDNARLDADVAITTSLAVDTDTLYAAGTSVGVNTASPDASFHVVGNAKISSDLIVGGSLTVQGNLTYLDTEVQVTEAVDITNAGSGPALKANQTGSEPIAEFQDDGVTVMKIFDGGNVAIGNVSADYLLTVDGIVSAEAYRGNAYALFDINAANVVGDITLDTASMFDLTVTNLISLEGNAKFDQNVAIGTALDPAYALKVQGNVWFGSDVRIESGVLYGNVDLVDGQVTTLEITEQLTVSGNTLLSGAWANVDTDMTITDAHSFTVATDSLFANASGVAIGTTTISPHMALDVVGNVEISANLSVSNVMMVDSVGKFVGINTANPAYPLDVRGSTSSSYGGDAYAYLTYDPITGISTGGDTSNSAPVTIKAEYRVTAAEFNALSDERIKKDIEALPTSQLLDLIMTASVKEYQYKDAARYGSRKRIGFVAQELREILPQAVSSGTDYRPDVYKKATKISQGTWLCPDHGLPIGDNFSMRIITSTDAYASSSCIVKDIDTLVMPDISSEEEEVFCFGTLGELLSIDQDQLSASVVGAVQELSKRMSSFEARLAAMESKCTC